MDFEHRWLVRISAPTAAPFSADEVSIEIMFLLAIFSVLAM
jgi:hypothetical protein